VARRLGVWHRRAERAYDLSKVCPKGWAAIHTETSFLNGLVQGLTLNIYSPQSITITCAAR
jgi:hypothetical protein